MQGIKIIIKSFPGAVKIYEVIMGIHYQLKKRIYKSKPYLRAKVRKSYGEKNKDKTFLIILSPSEFMGLYSTVLHVIPVIEYAERKNYIPVVDFRSSYVPLIQDIDRKGMENAWEYYFEQPYREYSLDEVYQSKNVISMVEHDTMVNTPKWNDMTPAPDQLLAFWNGVMSKYIRVNERIQKRIDEEKARLFRSDQGYLGVAVRAGYRAGMLKNLELYNNHAKMPSCEDYIDIIKERLQEWKYDVFFLACDDREYANKISGYFGDKCVLMDRRLKHYFKNDEPVTNQEEFLEEYKGSSIRETTEEYIVETYLLAQCDSLYGGIAGGSQFAYFLNGGKYKHLEIYNEGVYAGLGK